MAARNPNVGRRAVGAPIAKSGITPQTRTGGSSTSNPNVGRHAMGSAIAKSGFQPPKQGAKDSGGGMFNPDQKPISGLQNQQLAQSPAPLNPPIEATGTSRKLARTTSKVAGVPKFYGK